MDLQLQLVSGWGLQKRRSVHPMSPCGSLESTLAFYSYTKFEHFGIIGFWVTLWSLVWKMHWLIMSPWPLTFQSQSHVTYRISQGLTITSLNTLGSNLLELCWRQRGRQTDRQTNKQTSRRTWTFYPVPTPTNSVGMGNNRNTNLLQMDYSEDSVVLAEQT